jgi:DNA-binding MarR family transcriptional regulator
MESPLQKKDKHDYNSETWNMISSIHHSIFFVRQQELKQHHIPIRQLFVLRAIRDLGPGVTLSDIAKRVERQPHVISRQTILMEKDGLIKRQRNTPKTNQLNFKITPKGLRIIESAQESEAIDAIFSSLTNEEQELMRLSLKKILANIRQFASLNIKEKEEVDFWLTK